MKMTTLVQIFFKKRQTNRIYISVNFNSVFCVKNWNRKIYPNFWSNMFKPKFFLHTNSFILQISFILNDFEANIFLDLFWTKIFLSQKIFLGSVPASIYVTLWVSEWVSGWVGKWSANFLATPHDVVQRHTM